MSEVMETKSPQTPRMIAVRRRSRQRRTRVVPIDWRRIALLGVILLCVLMLVLDRKLGGSARMFFTNIRVAIGGLRLEVIALVLCGVVWFCLTPGIEDRISRFFKNRFDPRQRRLGRTRGRRR